MKNAGIIKKKTESYSIYQLNVVIFSYSDMSSCVSGFRETYYPDALTLLPHSSQRCASATLLQEKLSKILSTKQNIITQTRTQVKHDQNDLYFRRFMCCAYLKVKIFVYLFLKN